MCFDRFLLAFESCDLSQADKSIKRVFSFPNWVMSSKSSFSVSQAWGLNFLKTKFCQSSQIYLSPEKTEKTVYFLSLTKTILPKCQIAFLGITVIYHSKIEAWGRRHSCTMKGLACSHQAYITWELPNKTFLFVKIYRWNFVRFHEILNHEDTENFSFLSWQTKKFYS